MGSTQTYPVKIFCFGDRNEILKEIFTTKVQNKDKWEYRVFKKEMEFKEKETDKTLKETIEWNATLYPDITDDNLEELFESLEKNLNIPDEFEESHINLDEDSRKRSRNIIIKFGKNNLNILINFMNNISKTYLPQICLITEEKFDEVNDGLYDNRFLTIIKEENKSDEELIDDLKNYLWSKECYYNERGHILRKPIKAKNDNKISTNNFVNIMITGISRSGKSTLINILSGKLITLESPFLESVTNNIREYEIIASNNGKFQTGIRFYDTPGLTKIEKKKVDTIKMVKKVIENKIDECAEAKDNIHLIYFVLRPEANLENYVDFFQFIIEMNQKRIKKGLKKISIIFIINKSNDKIAEDSLREFLFSNKLNELYEKIPVLGENKVKLTYKERFSKKVIQSEKREIKSNIISVNILKTKNSPNVYGIDSLLEATLYFLKKDNPFKAENFEKIEKIKTELDEIDCGGNVKKEKKKELQMEANKLYNEIGEENSFLKGCNNIMNILEKAKYDSNEFFFYNTFFFHIFHKTINMDTFLLIFKEIENCYKIFTDEISIIPLLKGNQFEFQIIEHLKEKDIPESNSLEEFKKNYDIEKIEINELILNVKGEKINLSKKVENMGFFESFKYFMTLQSPLLVSYKKFLIEYFENYIRMQCGTDYILRQKQIYTNIFQQIDEMSKKKDWDIYHAEIYD